MWNSATRRNGNDQIATACVGYSGNWDRLDMNRLVYTISSCLYCLLLDRFEWMFV